MKAVLFAPFLLLAASCTTEAPPAEASAEARSELAAFTAGRVAGEPQSCVRQSDLQGNRSVGGQLVFETRSRDLVFVNDAQCPELSWGRALRTRTSIGQLCAGDIAEVIDASTGMQAGACGLGRFTPYRRPR